MLFACLSAEMCFKLNLPPTPRFYSSSSSSSPESERDLACSEAALAEEFEAAAATAAAAWALVSVRKRNRKERRREHHLLYEHTFSFTHQTARAPLWRSDKTTDTILNTLVVVCLWPSCPTSTITPSILLLLCTYVYKKMKCAVNWFAFIKEMKYALYWGKTMHDIEEGRCAK